MAGPEEDRRRRSSFMQSFQDAFKVVSDWKPRTSLDCDGKAIGSGHVPAEPLRLSAKGGASALLDRVQELHKEIDMQRKTRLQRAAQLNALDDTAKHLRVELSEERSLLEQADDDRARANEQEDAAVRELEELQERHYALLSRKAKQEAELRRYSMAAWAEELAAREARRDREWARDGPETDALKDSKLALAEALQQLEEARHQSRKELAQLQQQLEQAQAENAQLLENATTAAPPKSFRRSVWEMLTAPGRREDVAVDQTVNSSA
mmetsp:Transcript_3200/g.3507  ORF Transcript_3200/g.3507 Transcript_3200/m.3507 type:complete len:266 (-) Transcript_3200:10-807(-)